MLQFNEDSAFVALLLEPGKLLTMHREIVENHLDGMHLSWAVNKELKPRVVVMMDHIVGTAVIWPFRLTGPLPYSVVRKCEYDNVCTVPKGTNFVLYGGL